MADPSTDPSRSAGAAYVAQIDQDKSGRQKSRSLRPLLQLWPFVKTYPGQLIAFLIFLILSALGSLAMPWIVKLIIDCGFGDGASTLPVCVAIDVQGDGNLNRYFLFAALFAVLFSIAGSLRFFFITRLGQRVILCLIHI